MRAFVWALGLLAIAGPAMAAERAADGAATGVAGVAGHWILDGKFERFAYRLDCRLTQTGEDIGGVCTDVATSDPQHKPQGSHAITSGKVDGDTVRFTYKTHFLAFPFAVNYSGVLDGDRMSGTITVPGWRGAFTAVRE